MWAQNPRVVLPPWLWGLLDVWAACRSPSPMGGMDQRLPCSGGAAEQPAGLMDALSIIDGLITPRKDAA